MPGLRHLLLLIMTATAGCNQLYDIHSTELVDARYFDAPIDAPFACPPAGELPKFSRSLVQTVPQDCTFYSESRELGLAAALCNVEAVVTGKIDSGHLDVAELVGGPSDFNHIRLSPEGDELWRAQGATVHIYRRIDDGHWEYARELGMTLTSPSTNDRVSAPSRRLDGKRRLIAYSHNQFGLQELEDDGTTVTPLGSYTAGQLGALYIQFPNLTADGLRLVFAGEPATGSSGPVTMYSARGSLSEPFPMAQPIPTAPAAFDPYLTEDCSRLYSWGLSSIFFAPQTL